MPKKNIYTFTAKVVEKPEGYEETFATCIEAPVSGHGSGRDEALRSLEAGLQHYWRVRGSGELEPAVQKIAEKRVKLPEPTRDGEADAAPRPLGNELWALTVALPVTPARSARGA